jgi:hypothetical protein
MTLARRPSTVQGIDPRILQWTVLMALVLGALGLGAWLISYVRRRMIEEDQDRDALSQFQEAYDAGEIDADEYRRVREALGRPAAGRDVGGASRPPARRPPRTDPIGPEAVSPPPGPEAPTPAPETITEEAGQDDRTGPP